MLQAGAEGILPGVLIAFRGEERREEEARPPQRPGWGSGVNRSSVFPSPSLSFSPPPPPAPQQPLPERTWQTVVFWTKRSREDYSVRTASQAGHQGHPGRWRQN